jgi:hypothetical protein
VDRCAAVYSERRARIGSTEEARRVPMGTPLSLV